jgi:hypothetical protein
MRRYHREGNGRRSRQHPHLERARPLASQPMPQLPAPFAQVSDCHWCVIHDEVTCTLFYDRACELWKIRFDWPGLTVGRCNEFDRDTPALQMQAEIIKAIDNRWPDDWMTENLPASDRPETVPGCYGLAKGVDY